MFHICAIRLGQISQVMQAAVQSDLARSLRLYKPRKLKDIYPGIKRIARHFELVLETIVSAAPSHQELTALHNMLRHCAREACDNLSKGCKKWDVLLLLYYYDTMHFDLRLLECITLLYAN